MVIKHSHGTEVAFLPFMVSQRTLQDYSDSKIVRIDDVADT
jgi:hypothetical protein